MEKHEAEEIQLINLFRQAWQDFPNGKLVKTESPDFILRCNRKTSIGIELTRLDNHIDQKGKKRHLNTKLFDQKAEKGIAKLRILPEQIESTIQRKEEKLSLYHKKLSDAYWLIITANIGSYTIPKNIGHWHFDTTFHKLFLLLLPDGKLFEFK